MNAPLKTRIKKIESQLRPPRTGVFFISQGKRTGHVAGGPCWEGFTWEEYEQLTKQLRAQGVKLIIYQLPCGCEADPDGWGECDCLTEGRL